MVRFYRAFAKLLTVYALLHPFVYLGGEWFEMRRMNAEVEAQLRTRTPVEAGWTDSATPAIGDGTPLLHQTMVYESVFSVPNVLLALLMSLGIVGIGALCLIAASLTELAAARPSGTT